MMSEDQSWLSLPWWLRLNRLFDFQESVPCSVRLGDFFSQFVLKWVGIGPGGRFKRERLEWLMKLGYITSDAQKRKINRDLGLRIQSVDLSVVSSRVHESVPIRVFYDPSLKTYKRTILFFHGGGFALGSPKMPHYHIFCSKLAAKGHVVFSVDYRLAPENPFPAAVHDSFAVLEWLTSPDGEEQLPGGTDRGRVVLVGDSAGGNLCAVLSSLVRDELDSNLEPCKLAISVDAQLLVYPVLFAGKNFTKFHKMDGWMLPAEVLKWFITSYLQCKSEEVKERMNDRRIAPLLAGVDKLPRTVIFIGTKDVLCEGCSEMRSQLRSAGIGHMFVDYPNEIHGFLDRNNRAADHTFQVIAEELANMGE